MRAILLIAVMTAAGCGGDAAPPDQPCGTDSGTGCAPDSERVDLYEPVFTNPTNVTNPLFPVSRLHSVVFVGVVGGSPFRTETTLLTGTRILEWNGQQIETLQSQYMAFSDGRIEEIATDWYAQDDLGGVWYFGEDVADYNEDGVVFTNEGTWLVGRDGAPVTMIMPADPKVGDVFRAENIAPIAWEEVTVVEVGVTVDGPQGPLPGAMIGSELHMDGTRQQKIFAPDHGEFSTGTLATDDLEQLALAIPADALGGSVPTELAMLADTTAEIFDAADAGTWDAASTALASLTGAWADYRVGQVPPLLEDEMVRLIALLADAVGVEDAEEARAQAIAVARVVFDLRLRHQPPSEIDRVRLDLWCAQALVDVEAGDFGSVRGDAATAGLVWNRIAHTFDAAASAEIVGLLADLSAAAAADDAPAIVTVADQLRAALAGVGW